jgi:methylmalonyl-CoA mutase C-terminal domain/subunit
MQRKIRVLVGKPGLDGHDRGAKVVAAALRDAGMEVIYTGLHQTPQQVVEAAVQEDVDVVALSVLSGAHMTLFTEILELMRARGIGDRLLTGGGIIPSDDMNALLEHGVGRLFGPGTNTQHIIGYIREWYGGVHGADALPPLPPPPTRPEPMVSAGDRPVPAPARERHHAPARPGRGQSAPRRAAAKRAAPKPKQARSTAPAKHAKQVVKKVARKAARKAAKKTPKKTPKKTAPQPARKVVKPAARRVVKAVVKPAKRKSAPKPVRKSAAARKAAKPLKKGARK